MTRHDKTWYYFHCRRYIKIDIALPIMTEVLSPPVLKPQRVKKRGGFSKFNTVTACQTQLYNLHNIIMYSVKIETRNGDLNFIRKVCTKVIDHVINT